VIVRPGGAFGLLPLFIGSATIGQPLPTVAATDSSTRAGASWIGVLYSVDALSADDVWAVGFAGSGGLAKPLTVH